MKPARILYHMVRADFLERVRRYSFVVTLAAALYLAYVVAAEKVWIVVGNGYRGVYNSAWIGVLMALCCSTFLSLAGFYIVKNSVQRDTDTRVGQILAATPMRKNFYTLAKTLSNFAVLTCMVLTLMLAAVAMQGMQAEAHSFSLRTLWSPFILFALPTMLLTASIALLFETIPILRGGVGNVVYFFLWSATLALGATGFDDPFGMQLLYRSTRNTLSSIDPDVLQKFNFSFTIGGERAVRTFPWDGFDWTTSILLMRGLWVAVAAGIALLASVFFHRFDPARGAWRRRRALDVPAALQAPSLSEIASLGAPAAAVASTHLTPLLRTSGSSRFLPLVKSELTLMLKGRRWWWYAGAAGLLVGQTVSPEPAVYSGFLLAAWIWPILLWSSMGCRETIYVTKALIFSSERSLSRQLPALWAAGFLVALFTGAGVGLQHLIRHDGYGFAAWLAGAMFIPSLALALGIWSRSSKAFEAIYTVWWYVGPAHHIPRLDFIGTTSASSQPGVYVVAAISLLVVSYLGRRANLGYA
jgi:hypothetical protein